MGTGRCLGRPMGHAALRHGRLRLDPVVPTHAFPPPRDGEELKATAKDETTPDHNDRSRAVCGVWEVWAVVGHGIK